jgi:hypothetical protein
MKQISKESYIERYKARTGSTKNASKSFVRYSEGVNKQFSQARRTAEYKARVRKAQKDRMN